jgi:predicted PurR-regulated permease PerM
MVLVGFSGGTSMGLYCIGVYIVVQGIDGNIVVPLVAKRPPIWPRRLCWRCS